jgi:hypothetical protein
MDTWSDRGGEEETYPPRKTLDEPLLAPNSVVKKAAIKRNLIQIIESILSSYELQEKYSTKLTPLCITIISDLIKKKPEFFRIVESTLIRNINDNKIKAEDVPYIITIISHLYHLLLAYNEEKNNEPITETCSNILKFIFSVSLRENLVKIDNETDTILLLLCLDNIVDSCIKLLKPKKVLEIAVEPHRVFNPPPAPTPPPSPQLPILPPTPPSPKATEKKIEQSSCCCY